MAVEWGAGGKDAKAIPATINEMLLRGCMLKNTGHILGLVVYTGKESRIQMNAAKTPLKVGECPIRHSVRRGVLGSSADWHLNRSESCVHSHCCSAHFLYVFKTAEASEGFVKVEQRVLQGFVAA